MEQISFLIETWLPYHSSIVHRHTARFLRQTTLSVVALTLHGHVYTVAWWWRNRSLFPVILCLHLMVTLSSLQGIRQMLWLHKTVTGMFEILLTLIKQSTDMKRKLHYLGIRKWRETSTNKPPWWCCHGEGLQCVAVTIAEVWRPWGVGELHLEYRSQTTAINQRAISQAAMNK